MKNQAVLSFVAVFLLATAISAHAEVLYVDDDAPPSGDGTSWDTAYRFLHDALHDAAKSGGAISAIRVAAGTYLPDPVEGDRDATFQLVNGVVVEGGYAGLGAADPDERDVAAYASILFGDLAGNDGPSFENYDDNSLHVVTGSGTDETASLDGFMIRGGNADGAGFPGTGAHGAGMLNDTGSPTVTRCRFEANRAFEGGAGMANLFGSSPTVTDCEFVGNATVLESSFGGGMENLDGSNATVLRCLFSGNTARTGFGFGGGLYAADAVPTVIACTFEENRAEIGGGLFTFRQSMAIERCTFANNVGGIGGGLYVFVASPVVTNCVFTGNSVDSPFGFFAGGGIHVDTDSRPEILNCTIAGNEAERGGGVYSRNDSITFLKNCILWGNLDNQISDESGATTQAKYCDVEGGWTMGSDNIDVDPMFIDPGTNHRLAPGSPCIDAGDNLSLPEMNTDRDDNPRFVDDPDTKDTGRGDPPIIDMGAYEFQPCAADLDGSGTVGVADILALLAAWGPCDGCPEDLDGNGTVGVSDILLLLVAWGPCP